MKEKREVYKQHAILEDIDGEDGRIHMNLAKLDLDITKDVDVSYYLPNKEDGHKDEKISFKEFIFMFSVSNSNWSWIKIF